MRTGTRAPLDLWNAIPDCPLVAPLRFEFKRAEESTLFKVQ